MLIKGNFVNGFVDKDWMTGREVLIETTVTNVPAKVVDVISNTIILELDENLFSEEEKNCLLNNFLNNDVRIELGFKFLRNFNNNSK